MQETWCSDPQEVEQEIRRLIAAMIPLTFYQTGQPPQRLLPVEIFSKDEQIVLILHKEATFNAPKDAGLLLYKQDSNPTRGFRATPVLETQKDLGITMPTSIFWLQRRKFQRFPTGNTSSSVTFTRHGSQYLNHGQVEDICLEGARISGKFSQHINNGDVLCPLSITLRLRFGNFEEKVHVAEAIVRRVIDRNKEQREFGIHFSLQGEEREKLERYIALCSLQAGAATGSGR